MSRQDRFGGPWTQQKLLRLRKYLVAYMEALKNQSFTTVYVDAFAGTGEVPTKGSSTKPGTAGAGDSETIDFLNGSVREALSLPVPFKRYLFIERNKMKYNELVTLTAQYAELAGRIQIENADANEFLRQWCRETDWKSTRAVVFLDPFGMQVEWSLLEAIAATKAIDLWLLVPVGMGLIRMMPRDELPPEEWASRLTTFFGTDEWRDQFYRPRMQPGLFDDGSELEKNVDYDGLAGYFVGRLRLLFAGVADNPLTLRNSKKSPLFLLCFAAGNERGAPIAIRIAKHLLKE